MIIFNRRITVIVFFFLLFTLGSIDASQKADEQRIREKIDSLMGATMKFDLFSGTILVAKEGRIIYTGAFGHANKDHNVSNTLNTRFNIGSIGKTFTATSILQLVQREKLKLDDTLEKFLPDFPFPEKATITIHHLLNHTSGLGNYMAHRDYRSKMSQLRKIDDVLPLIYEQKPEFQAGERFRYSNSGMVILGAIIEKVSGLTYAEYIKQNIFDPLGMNDSGIVYVEQVVPNRSTGYIKGPNNSFMNNITREPPAFSDGGLYTTAKDLLKFDQALYGEKLLSGKIKTIMFTPKGSTDGYAYGWGTGKVNGRRFVGHAGGAPGINAMFRRYIDDSLTLIVLSNYDGAAMEVYRNIQAILLGQEATLPTQEHANFLLGYNLEMRGYFREALKEFAKNLLGDKPHKPSLYQSARAKIAGKFDLEAAIKQLDLYIKLADSKDQPTAADAWWRKGVAFELLGKNKESINCHKTALKLNPKHQLADRDLKRLRQGSKKK